jgi:tellurite resistance protein TehA-like permease
MMGTGTVANADPTPPLHVAALRETATVIWAIAAAWLVVLCSAMAGKWWRNRSRQLAHLHDPVLAHFGERHRWRC